MPLKLEVLCSPGIASGFALAGLRPTELESADKTATLVRDLVRRPDVGVLLLEQRSYDELPDDLRRDVGRRPVPLVVPFPGPSWETRSADAEAYVVELLRQVIGYRVRLK